MGIKTLARQPKPFYLIFLFEIWERFGFYGVQVLLVLYMVQFYNHLFLVIGIITVGISLVLFLFVPLLKRLAVHETFAINRMSE